MFVPVREAGKEGGRAGRVTQGLTLIIAIRPRHIIIRVKIARYCWAKFTAYPAYIIIMIASDNFYLTGSEIHSYFTEAA